MNDKIRALMVAIDNVVDGVYESDEDGRGTQVGPRRIAQMLVEADSKESLDEFMSWFDHFERALEESEVAQTATDREPNV